MVAIICILRAFGRWVKGDRWDRGGKFIFVICTGGVWYVWAVSYTGYDSRSALRGEILFKVGAFDVSANLTLTFKPPKPRGLHFRPSSMNFTTTCNCVWFEHLKNVNWLTVFNAGHKLHPTGEVRLSPLPRFPSPYDNGCHLYISMIYRDVLIFIIKLW